MLTPLAIAFHGGHSCYLLLTRFGYAGTWYLSLNTAGRYLLHVDSETENEREFPSTPASQCVREGALPNLI